MGNATIFGMLDGKYINEKILGYYQKPPTFSLIVQVSLGVGRSFEEFPHTISWPLEEPIEIAGQRLGRFNVHIYNYDSTLAPLGKTVLKVLLNSDYDYWKKLKEESDHYKTGFSHAHEQNFAWTKGFLYGWAMGRTRRRCVYRSYVRPQCDSDYLQMG